ncbi:MAG TPA: protein kinase [Terriglobia bacterium]|nr:protein kinase [Terriglobia bacterium]
MILTPGARVGSYQVLSPLGAGGMGEVYRARDTKLAREVALKVLPAAVAQDAERVARFRREAQLLASLNHPNIAHIHGLEESHGTLALVMELVEGETLAARVAGPALGSAVTGEVARPVSHAGSAVQIEEALELAIQIAEGLEYAHEKGIVHRDLKPANVKITPEGKVKILDFGLAKALITDVSGSNLSNSPTMGFEATQAGAILGTAAYMSPEQAKGRSVDRRADIWAFGCLLYEMLSGARPFSGDSVSDTLAAVIRDEPDWQKLPGATPGEVQRLIRRCLIKDPKQRLRDIGEARLTIEEALGGAEAAPGLGSAEAITPSGIGAPAGATTVVRRSALHRAIAGVAAVVALALAGVAGHFLWRTPAQPSWTGVKLGGPTRASGPRLSPDGRLLAFDAADPDGVMQLWVMQPESGNYIMLTHNRERGYVANYSWSPDGSRIYYDRWYDQPKGIFSVPALGGAEQLLLEDAMTPEALPDGSLLTLRFNSQNQYQEYRYWPESGRSQALPVSVQPGIPLNYVRVIPGGRHALVIGSRIGGPGTESGIHLYDLDISSGSMRRLPEEYPGQFAGTFVTVAPSRDGKYAITATLHGDTYQVSALPLDGYSPPRAMFSLIQYVSSLDMGPDGSIYLDQNDRQADLLRFSADGGRAEEIAELPTPDDDYQHFAVLPDGRVVWGERTASHSRLILLAAGKDPSPLVNTSEDTGGPMTGVGSDQVAFMIGQRPRHHIALAALSNGRITRHLSFDQGEVSGMGVSPDRQTLYCLAGGAVWSVPLSGGAPRKIRDGDGFAVDASTGSLVIQVRQPPNTRLIRVPFKGGPEQEIAGPFPLAYSIDSNSIRNGKLVAPMSGPRWFWRPGIFDLATGKSASIPLDYPNEDFQHMAWTPDGRIMAVADSWSGSIWKFTPQVK